MARRTPMQSMVSWALQVSLVSAPLAVALAPRPAMADAAEDAAVRRAGALATEAKLLFQQKVYDQAAERFMEAYTLVKRPALLFNAARAYEEGGLLAKAVALFKAYVALGDAPADGKTDAAARIQRMQAVLDAQRAAEEAKAAAARQAEQAKEARAAQEAKAAQDAKAAEHAKAEARARAEAEARQKAERDAALAKKIADQRAGAAKLPGAEARPFPWAAVGATAGAAIGAAVLYGMALGEESAAAELEPNLKTQEDKTRYLEHAGNFDTYRVAALGVGIVAVGFGAWAGYEFYRRGQAAVAPPRQTRAWQWHLLPTGVALSF